MTDPPKTAQLEPAYDIPAFESDDEAADWFMNHDLSKLELEQVDLPARQPLTTVSLRLPGAEVAELKARARRMGVGYTTYVRMLVSRHLLEERPIGERAIGGVRDTSNVRTSARKAGSTR